MTRTKRDLLGVATTPDGGGLALFKEHGGYTIYCDKRVLMASHTHGSEEAMARIASHDIGRRTRPRMLIGGLGLGFTLRAALDRLPADAEVVVVELMEAIVEWHKGPLGELSGHAIDDPRVSVFVGDVTEVLRDLPGDAGFDAILLDVDNGPIPMTVVGNWWLYAAEGLAAIHAATRPGGTLIVWSAGPDPSFVRRVRQAGYVTEARRVQTRTGRRKRRRGGNAHTLFIGRRRNG